MDVLMGAESRGFGGHGLIRLERIVKGIKAGTHEPNAEPSFDKSMPSVLKVDGKMALGADVSTQTAERLISVAQKNGVGLAAIRNITHFGFGGYYTEMAAAEGLMGLVVCNTEPAAAPFGGKGKVLGTNPISFSCPRTGGADPLTVDLATTAAARGRLLKAAMTGEKLPDNLAVDAAGTPTNDAKEGLAGALCPLGGPFGYKGTGLALMVDLLGGALTGSNTGKRVTGTATTDVPCTAGHLFVFLNPELIAPDVDQFASNVEAVVADFKASGGEVLLPGEKEHASLTKANTSGLQISAELCEMLDRLEA